MQGVVKFWEHLKDVVEIIDLSGFGGKLKKNIEKETFIFFTSYCKYCILETKHSLGSDAMSNLHLPAFESILLSEEKKKWKKLPTRWIFVFTLPKPVAVICHVTY